MFDLIENWKRPKIKPWTIPATVFLIFGTGVSIGILIGRRTTNPLDWLEVIFLVLVTGRVLWPIGRELMVHRTPDEKTDGE